MEVMTTLNFIERMTLDEYVAWKEEHLEFVDEYHETGLVVFPNDDYPSTGRVYYTCWEGDWIAIYQVTGMGVIETPTRLIEKKTTVDRKVDKYKYRGMMSDR